MSEGLNSNEFRMEGVEETAKDNDSVVRLYFDKILQASRRLATVPGSSGMECEDDNRELSLEQITDRIAHQLLEACRLSVLSSSTDNLPEHAYPQSKHDPIPSEDDKQEYDKFLYVRRRIDYLRLLLRAMAPIAMDVAARTSSILQAASTDENGIIDPTLRQAAFVLFSVWLPVALHIKPLVSGLFALESFSCPLTATALPDEHAWLLAEAAHHLCYFYCRKQQEHQTVVRFWNWSPLFGWITDNNAMEEDDQVFAVVQAARWHAVRAAGFCLNLAPAVKAEYYERHGVEKDTVPWVIHPWEIDHEEYTAQKLYLSGQTRIWEDEFPSPGSDVVRTFLPLHPFLVEVGAGLVFVKHNAIRGAEESDQPMLSAESRERLVHTFTTERNLFRIGTALCRESCPPPMLLCGPAGSGKSSLVREVCRLFAAAIHGACHRNDLLLEIHVDEETDTKTLVGSYTATDIPGEFEWRPGALTRAIREGKWVLMEDMDTVPMEIQSSLVQLFKERLLPLGNGKVERCHPDFRLFGTLTTQPGRARGSGSSSMRLMNPSLWHRIDIDPLPFAELKAIATGRYPNLPDSIVESALLIFKRMDQSGRRHMDGRTSNQSKLWFGRNPSVRDLFKLFSRIEATVSFEKDVIYATESQRTLCFAETVDIFVAACPENQIRHDFVREVVAPTWGISADLASSYVDTRCPTIHLHSMCTEVGRSKISVSDSQAFKRTRSEYFAQTSYALRLVESLAVCVRQNEPALLVGETGTGKTSVLQHLAKLAGRELVVQNLSLQTDSTDLLGGYRPLEIRNVARRAYQTFVDLFTSTFSRKQNAEFLSFASSALQKGNWKKLSQVFRRAGQMGLKKVKERNAAMSGHPSSISAWKDFCQTVDRFEQQRLACDSGLAFVFSEGALVDAIRRGKWVLLDEINLASSETLQRLCGLLDDSNSSLTLTERGDSVALHRHPEFRLFSAMNPSTDNGKKDLNASVRSRFTEIFVDELLDPVELRVIAGSYLSGVLPVGDRPPEHTDTVIAAVEAYLEYRRLASTSLSDASGQRPRYTLRTLTRALVAARNIVLQQKMPLKRALLEGFALAFEGQLDVKSRKATKNVLSALSQGLSKKDLDRQGRRPGGRTDTNFVLLKPFWIQSGPLDVVDWSEETAEQRGRRFILTPSTGENLRRLSRAVASGPWPILLEGPTSAGKTSLVEYLAARCGHRLIRINNHEHTDVQEYTGGFAADANGSLSFQDGLLVQALRKGDWVILDELNLAPSEVLEALNRLLDDNRELYLAEVNETVKAHPSFRLFATQNPSGAYGGRKPLSRAFRNRFVEIHVNDIPSAEMVSILQLRCGCPPSHAKHLVSIMDSLRQRRSRSGVFLGKDGFISPRDLLRWAERGASSKRELAREGFMLLAERLRNAEEKDYVKREIEAQLEVDIDIESLYYGESSEARMLLEEADKQARSSRVESFVKSVAPTRSLLRVMTLVLRCIKQREPVLLVGDTGCGKTTVVHLLSSVLGSRLHTVNCHATTETSDLLGALRPVRGRALIAAEMLQALQGTKHFFEGKKSGVWKSLRIPDVVKLSWMRDSCGAQVTGLSYVEVNDVMSFAGSILGADTRTSEAEERSSKRRKLDSEDSMRGRMETKENIDVGILEQIGELLRRYYALFEWADGPMVTAMKQGDSILLDEMSLAEDAVLERLNSILEPSRTLVLAERGASSDEDERVIGASDGFQLFATMNPGGDFGKRELSPALRSRFTEIWVPAITDKSDIDMVLQQSLSESLAGPRLSVVKEHILSYVDWFNEEICGCPSSPCSGLSLSLRDILTWASFVVAAVDANNEINLGDVLLHGARLVHLDGLGLGTGLSLSDVVDTKQRAESFLRNQLGLREWTKVIAVTPKVEVTSGRFGCFPFWISLGSETPQESSFNFHAGTSAVNTQRVLRAMQLRKPILLEGSPGVGKTALISAVAAASGNKLVRINLSEQTDVSDLMGSDLPLPDQDSPATTRASFRWCDGVLLSAIKHGDWVLLDELNLASQSVLEGLNSCLDHRANVFIPELGQTFDCLPSFRVFAAQNPLAQGGGRKGLPKSFLNRFTKVYVDPLSMNDMAMIAMGVFPHVGKDLIKRMIYFNSCVHNATVVAKAIGNNGSPWEFNLRDIFRLCSSISEIGVEHFPSFLNDLYVQRFRTVGDRQAVQSMYADSFDVEYSSSIDAHLRISKRSVLIGNTRLLRADLSPGEEPLHREARLGHSMREPLMAVARCIAMKWPCLLVGGPATGKSTLVRAVADATNTKIVEIALSPSTDVSELVGCYEQVDTTDCFRDAASDLLKHAVMQVVLSPPDLAKEELCELLFQLRSLVDSEKPDTKEVAALALRVISLLKESEKAAPLLQRDAIISLLETFKEYQNAGPVNDRTEAWHFLWKDGILVEAMVQGHWLHLLNANLCPSSVLDRLNSVMEPGGTLLLAEGATGNDSEASFHREIKCHQNFRMFLSMDPDHGEVSRAMRNRCVEISLDNQSDRRLRIIDAMDRQWQAGLRVDSLSEEHSGDLGSDRSDFESNRSLQAAGDITSSLIQRNPSPGLFRTAPGSLESMPKGFSPKGRESSYCRKNWPLLGSISLRDGCSLPHGHSRFLWEARLLRLFVELDRGCPALIVPSSVWSPCWKQDLMPCLSSDAFEGLWGDLGETDYPTLRNNLLVFYLARSGLSDLASRVEFMYHLNGSLRHSSRFLSACTARFVSEGSHFASVTLWRLPQLLKENVWVSQMKASVETPKVFINTAVLDLAFYIANGRIDRAAVGCPLLPLIFPFFRAFDDNATQLAVTCRRMPTYRKVLSHRDNLWDLLSGTVYLGSLRLGGACFDTSDFIVQWMWLRREWRRLEASLPRQPELFLGKKIRQLDRLTEMIEAILFETTDLPRGICSSGPKRLVTALVPRDKNNWEVLRDIRQLSASLTVAQQVSGNRSELLDLAHLITCHHHLLLSNVYIRREILVALATVHLVATDEMFKSGGPELLNSTKGIHSDLQKQILRMSEVFTTQLKAIRLDSTILTVENVLGVQELERAMQNDSPTQPSYGNVKRSLLQKFAAIQLAPFAEYWCERKEYQIIRLLSRFLVQTCDPRERQMLVAKLAPSLRNFVDVVLSYSLWDVDDLRPIQTLLWFSEADTYQTSSTDQFLWNILHVMCINASKRTWWNSLDLLKLLSPVLELPSLLDSDSESNSSGPRRANAKTSLSWTPNVQNVPCSLVFSLLGDVFNADPRLVSGLVTIENYEARNDQVCRLIELMTTLQIESNWNLPFEILFYWLDTLRVMKKSFPSDSYYRLVELLKSPGDLDGANQELARQLLEKSDNHEFRKCIPEIMVPLLGRVVHLWSDTSVDPPEDLAFCRVYIGLLRFKLSIPYSPVDPGRKSLSKITIIDIELKRLGVYLLAAQVESAYIEGGTMARNPRFPDVVSDYERLSSKRVRQKKKIVERPTGIPAFAELFRELRDFSCNFVSLNTLLNLAKNLSDSRADEARATCLLHQSQQWQKTTHAFCRVLLSKYAAYADVILPVVGALATINEGLATLVEEVQVALRDLGSLKTTDMLSFCLTFPFRHLASADLIQWVRSFDSNTGAGQLCKRALGVAVLARLQLKARVSNVDKDLLTCWLEVVSCLQDCGGVEHLECDESAATEHELTDQDFRTKFPDHHREFRPLVGADDIVGDRASEAEGEEDGVVDEDLLKKTPFLDGSWSPLLASIHERTFGSKAAGVRDSMRLEAFELSYSAGYLMYTTHCDGSTEGLDDDIISGLTLALRRSMEGPCSEAQRGSELPILDFQRDPNPIEALKASEPLERMASRLAQLLTVFPGNAILLSIVRVVERVKKMNVHSVPLGKVMTGLEVVLKHSQDWEQYASTRVRLGDSLAAVRHVVSKWRKLELASWSDLLRSRETERSRRAKMHWVRMHNAVRETLGLTESVEPCRLSAEEADCASPSWLWQRQNEITRMAAPSREFLEASKVFDTFILSSPLGEFETRLRMLKTFTNQMELEIPRLGRNSGITLTRFMRSLYLYYLQFSGFVEDKRNELRRPLEEKLRNNVKLAKWDEQTYYAQAESTERNHRMLMRILREYDEVLDLNIGELLKAELSRGVRDGTASQGEASTMPETSSFFPMRLTDERKPAKPKPNYSTSRVWVDTSCLKIPASELASKIGHYCRRMASMLKRSEKFESPASQGSIEASTLCGVIFDRIDSLRSDTATRPMKERALVDLLRELRDQGFTNRKWTVPQELGQIGNLFQLPSLDPLRAGDESFEDRTVQGAERYYQRSVAEMARLNVEVTTLGSRHLTTSQVDGIRRFADHGLLLLAQQRCTAVYVTTFRNQIQNMVGSVDDGSDELPLRQTVLKNWISEFESARDLAVESGRQLRLSIACSQSHGEKEKIHWARDVVASLDSLLSDCASMKDSTLVTSSMITIAREQLEKIDSLSKVITECRDRSVKLGCLPKSMFDICLSHLSTVQDLGGSLQEITVPADFSGERAESNEAGKDSLLRGFKGSVSQAVNATLLTVQVLLKTSALADDVDKRSLLDLHRATVDTWFSSNLMKLSTNLHDVLLQLRSVHDLASVSSDEYKYCFGLSKDLCVLCSDAIEIVTHHLREYYAFHRSCAKLQYVLLRVFRVLVAKGFCAIEESEVNSGEGGTSGMSFADDQEGTGMGEGEGKKDVTDEIDNEDQLLGLKGDQKDEEDDSGNGQPRQLDEEEAEKGMEMEGDFEGSMYDMPESGIEEGADTGNEDNEEELDREMGDGSGLNEEVIDEKLWDESDDENNPSPEEEKLEKNSAVKGTAAEDEMMTKEDEHKESGENEDLNDADDKKEKQALNQDAETCNHEEAVNQDSEDKYEENHGLNIRDEKGDDEENDDMQIDEDLALDEALDQAEDEEGQDETQRNGIEDAAGAPEADELESENGKDSGGEENDDLSDTHTTRVVDDDNLDDMPPEEPQEVSTEASRDTDKGRAGLGVRSVEGKDAVLDDNTETECGGQGEDEAEAEGLGAEGLEPSAQAGTSSGGNQGSQSSAYEQSNERQSADEMPNPLRSPGDATKFWHRKLNIIQSSEDADQMETGRDHFTDEKRDVDGDFEHVGQNQESTSQALGEVEDKDALQLDINEDEPEEGDAAEKQSQKQELKATTPSLDSRTRQKRRTTELDEAQQVNEGKMNDAEETENAKPKDDATVLSNSDDGSHAEAQEVEDSTVGNQVVSDLSQLHVSSYPEEGSASKRRIIEEEQTTCISTAEVVEARARWGRIQGETAALSRRLCEKLRLVMEPLVASKLRGDYRTGKRINMKRVIGYIASGYRKDKIWLRRTKPAKRNYRILVAVDDSESMLKSGAGDMALKAMATLATGMSQLEIGELGIASFGDEMNLVHPFNHPFTSESGANVVRNFRFDQQRTRTAVCVESAMMALDVPGDTASMQLVFIISDGRIERESRTTLRRLIREMMERNILLAMIIVEGGEKKDSILNMKEVSFEKGKPKVKRFIEGYPFPYYILLEDMLTLPEVLGDALRQWFEMLTRLQPVAS